MPFPDDAELARLSPGAAPRGPLPPARSYGWDAWRRTLAQQVAGLSAERATPTAIWRLLHAGAPPPRGA
eukprot:11188047-Lingulodinium_polyedra.AAC.1